MMISILDNMSLTVVTRGLSDACPRAHREFLSLHSTKKDSRQVQDNSSGNLDDPVNMSYVEKLAGCNKKNSADFLSRGDQSN